MQTCSVGNRDEMSPTKENGVLYSQFTGKPYILLQLTEKTLRTDVNVSSLYRKCPIRRKAKSYGGHAISQGKAISFGSCTKCGLLPLLSTSSFFLLSVFLPHRNAVHWNCNNIYRCYASNFRSQGLEKKKQQEKQFLITITGMATSKNIAKQCHQFKMTSHCGVLFSLQNFENNNVS